MGKPKLERQLADNEALAVATMLRTSPRKLDLVAGLIRGMDAGRAVVTLEFSRKRIAQAVRKTLESAIANAENNHNLDVDRLFVAEASVGKHLVMKRLHARARGRAGRIEKHVSRLRIVVRERADAAAAAAPTPERAEREAA
jgi:large subunit ribosomal protein L22